MSSARVQYRHDPRCSFTMPPNKRTRTQFLAFNTAGPPPPMNQVPLTPFYQQNAAQVMVASRPSHFSALPVPLGQDFLANPIRPYPVPGPQPLMQGHANATRTVVWPTAGIPTPPGPPSQNGVLPVQFPVSLPLSFLPNSVPGLISMPNQLQPLPEQQTPPQDSSIGLEFNHAKLNVRYESVIKSLYADLPRQCATCGMRFKTKEEHSDHMDCHVRKNRDAKKSKQKKQMLSRKYFLTSKLWLSAAEAIGTPTGPAFFDNVEDDKKQEKSCDVLADENQKECPLCLDAFEEYFSNETNDWMCREAVRFNPAKIPTRKLYRSLIGHIVHAKCVSTNEFIFF